MSNALDDLDRDILAAVKACGDNAYGVPIYNYMLENGHGHMMVFSISVLYLRLQGMENMGVVRSWETPGGPERGYRVRRYWAIVESTDETDS